MELHRVSMKFHGGSMEVPWSFHGGYIEFPWRFHEVP